MGDALLLELQLFFLCTIIHNGLTGDAVLTFEPDWSTFYSGESVTFMCDMKEGEKSDWEYSIIKNDKHFISLNSQMYRFSPLHPSYSDEYQCRGRQKKTGDIKFSKTVSLTVAERPGATLTAGPTTIPVGGKVTLSCSVGNSADWRYQWFRRTSESDEVQITTNNNEQNREITVTQGGIYRCRGERGTPAFYSDISHDVMIKITYSNKVVVSQQPNQSQVFSGETMTLTCEVQGGETTEWTYEWMRSGSVRHQTDRKHWTFTVSESSSGDYSCQCRRRDDWDSSTEWSETITLVVSPKPRSVLSVSPSWLSPGASVTLSCEVEPPSAGWRFFWYKAVPDPPNSFYKENLLPGSTNGTDQDFYIIHGQKHTAGYVCRAGRSDREFSAYYSKPKFVWSGDSHPAASLTVNPGRVQHFSSASVSLTCEGNSTKWKVRRFKGDFTSRCSIWGTESGSRCDVTKPVYGEAVYWCESGSEFSNAVNITAQSGDIILVSPVLLVTEGESVTLGCRLKTGHFLSSVLFYKNEKLIQNDSRTEMKIAKVLKDDEGFYKCQHSRKTSQQSWLGVRSSSALSPESSSFPVLLAVGLVGGILLFILLLLLCLYKQLKDSCIFRSQSTNQNSVADQDEPPLNKDPSDPHGQSCLYESVKDTENHAVYAMPDESMDVTYSSVELKCIKKKGKNNKPEEASIYSELKMGSSAEQ